MSISIEWIRKSALILGLIIVGVVAIAVAPLGTLADETFNRFRVQQFAAITVPVDMDAMMDDELGHDLPEFDQKMQSQLAIAMMGLGDFETTFDHDSIRKTDSVNDAENHMDGTLRLPGSLPDVFGSVKPQVVLSDAGSASVTIDVERAQMLSSFMEMELASLPDPNEHPEVTVTIDVPRGAALVYEAGETSLVIGQMESPTLKLPESIDPELLRDDILAIPGIPPDVVAQVRAIEDWDETLIIPVPEDATTYNEVINGTSTLVIEWREGTAVLWENDGDLHVIAGNSPTDQILDVADSMI